jgi:hypothetical protein
MSYLGTPHLAFGASTKLTDFLPREAKIAKGSLP